jgi:TRAP-type C4-dicarboxylate transport system permease small subunit
VRLLSWLAKLCAILAGLLLTVITLITCYNLIMRNFFDESMVGAFELTAVATGAAIALFMPLAQARQGHIIVDFFTTGLSDKVNGVLDRIGALMLSLVFIFLAWRVSIGGINAYDAGSQTMLMGFPEWIVYAAMVPPFIVTAIIALSQAALGFESLLKEVNQ